LQENFNAGFVNHTNGQVLRTSEQKILLNIFNSSWGKSSEKKGNWIGSGTAEATNISKSAVYMEGIMSFPVNFSGKLV